ncbi:MAG: TolC family protein, partial [Hydrogenophaga sp.]
QDDGSTGVLLRVDQPLWSGGRISAGIDAAKWREQANQAASAEAREEVSLRVIAAAVEAARQQMRARVASRNVAAHEELLGMIQRRVRQEVSPMADQRLAESRLLASRNELSSIEQQRRAALTQLAQLVGAQVSAVDTDSIEAVAQGMPDGLDQAMAVALAQSPALRRIGAEIEAAAAEIQSKKAVYLPQLSIRLESQQGKVRDNRAMLLLQAQPGAGLSAASGVAEAVARRESLLAQRAALERDIDERVTLSWNEAQSARERTDDAERIRATAAEVAESFARQYTAGRKSWMDVLNAVREASLAELSLADVKAQFWGAALRLMLLTGRLPFQMEGEEHAAVVDQSSSGK